VWEDLLTIASSERDTIRSSNTFGATAEGLISIGLFQQTSNPGWLGSVRLFIHYLSKTRKLLMRSKHGPVEIACPGHNMLQSAWASATLHDFFSEAIADPSPFSSFQCPNLPPLIPLATGDQFGRVHDSSGSRSHPFLQQYLQYHELDTLDRSL